MLLVRTDDGRIYGWFSFDRFPSLQPSIVGRSWNSTRHRTKWPSYVFPLNELEGDSSGLSTDGYQVSLFLEECSTEPTDVQSLFRRFFLGEVAVQNYQQQDLSRTSWNLLAKLSKCSNGCLTAVANIWIRNPIGHLPRMLNVLP